MTFHRRSVRLRGNDYRDGGMYFVTICTKKREQIFGEIRNGIMGLSTMGCIVADELQKTPIIRPCMHIDCWVIMPNHIHILFNIDHHVGALCHNAPTNNKIPRLQSGSLGSMIGQLKIVSTKRIRKIDPGFSWQRNYHEHIIRNEDERLRIHRYILDNPAMWD